MFNVGKKEEESTAKTAKTIDASNIDKLTFKAYINSGAQSPMPGGGKFPHHLIDTLENLKKYAEEHDLVWMWYYDNGYSTAGMDASTFDAVKKGILNRSHGRTVWLNTQSAKDGFKHRSDS